MARNKNDFYICILHGCIMFMNELKQNSCNAIQTALILTLNVILIWWLIGVY